MRPPPGPGSGPPGLGVFGPLCSLQQADESLSASSKVTISRPSRNAGEPTIRGTHVRRNVSAAFRPPAPPSAHVASCPSAQRSGVMNE